MGVQFVTDGSVYSIQDLLSEQTVSYVCSDFTPLMPLTASSFYNPAENDRTVAPERTVADVSEPPLETTSHPPSSLFASWGEHCRSALTQGYRRQQTCGSTAVWWGDGNGPYPRRSQLSRQGGGN